MNTRHLLTALTISTAVAPPLTLTAAQTITYDVRFPNVVHHEAEISFTVRDLAAGPLEVRMSRSSPGRYALHEFAKNVSNVRVTDAAGNVLPVTRSDPYSWHVPEHPGTVRVTYTLFANRAGGTYSQVDESHAHLNMPAAFMWAAGLDDRPIEIAFHPPAESAWRIATQLFPGDEPNRFTAPSLQYFMDSPTELSSFALREWPVEHDGTTYTIRLAIHHLGTEAEVDAYAEVVRNVVQQEIAVFGEPAPYDGGTYTFIADYLPWASGDGMEHRNSTILASRASLARAAQQLIGTVSHEFFHSWNVERIRPASLEPFDFTRANMSRALWFAEGFTSYYTSLILRRAGLRSDNDYAQSISSGLDFVINSPARAVFSAVEMSMQAPFVDAATAVDPTNRENTFISYYTWGSVIGLALDLTLRSRFDITLDAYMRRMWLDYGKPERFYTVDDLENALAGLTADSAFAADFFARYIRGHDVADYAALLAHAAFIMRPSRPGGAFLGFVQLEYREDGALVKGNTRRGAPLYAAGVDAGDRIVSIGGDTLRSNSDWQAIKAAHRPGETVDIVYESRGRRRLARLTFAEDPRLEVVTYEEAGRTVTDAARTFREAWLGRQP